VWVLVAGDPTEYRKNSEECRKQAATAQRADHKDQWSRLADSWRGRADSVEQASAMAFRLGSIDLATPDRPPPEPHPSDGPHRQFVAADTASAHEQDET
jgi:hypothetical protein